MSNDFKKLLKVCAAIGVLIAAVRIAHEISLRLLKRVDRCDMPCQWDYEKGFDNCRPLKLTLEVKVTPQPRGGRHMVWYRATATNQSCAIIHLDDSFYLNGFANDSRAAHNDGSFLSVIDALGRAASDGPASRNGDMAGVETEIHPYRTNTTSVHTRHFKGERGEYTIFHLKPGESAVTSFDELAPYREKIIEVRGGSLVGTGATFDPVPMPHPERAYAVPPPGFRRLTEYDLKPGRYTAQFVVKEKSVIGYYRDPATSGWKRIAAGLTHLFAGPNTGPGEFAIDAVSPPVEFTVPK